MSNTREFVSASGTANDVVQKLAQAVYALGGHDADLRRVISDEALRGKLALDIMGIRHVPLSEWLPAPTGLVVVDTTLGLKGLLAACELDGSFDGILDPKWNPPPVLNRGRYEVEVEYLELGSDMSTADIETMLDKKGYRPALPEETLAGCAKGKNLQRRNPIVCLGAFWVDPDGNPHALVLGGRSGERRVYLDWDDPERRWDAHYRVAVVRK